MRKQAVAEGGSLQPPGQPSGRMVGPALLLSACIGHSVNVSEYLDVQCSAGLRRWSCAVDSTGLGLTLALPHTSSVTLGRWRHISEPGLSRL